MLASVLVVAGLELRRPLPVELIPTLTEQPEYCLTCHADLPEISAAHPVKTFGCVICHGGERLALDADVGAQHHARRRQSFRLTPSCSNRAEAATAIRVAPRIIATTSSAR